MPSSILELGTRVELRRPTARDADVFLRLVRESRNIHRPWVAPPRDYDGFMQFIRRTRGARHEAFFICARSTRVTQASGRSGSIAGVINLNEIIRGNFQSATLGYYVFSAYAGTGCMTEGMKLVIRHTFGTMKLHRLEANIQPGNEPSIALVKRCGFTREGFSPRFLKVGGQWRDHERWAIRSDDLL